MSSTTVAQIRGWTPLPHCLFEEMRDLTEIQLRLLLCIVRNTLGWHRMEVALSIPIIAEQTGMHETSVRRARVDLEEKGLLSVSMKTLRGRQLNVFRLLLPEEPDVETSSPAEPPDSNLPPCTVHGVPMHRAWHAKKEPSNEERKKQQQRPALVELPSDQAAVPIPHPAAVLSETDLNEEQLSALERILEAGVGRTMALRLLANASLDVICTALDNLPHRHAKRPAALLVREIQEGGWETPRELQDLRKDQEAERKHRLEEEQRAQGQEAQAAAEEDAFETAWSALSAERREQVLEEARRRIAWAAHLPGALEEGSHLLAGAVREVVATGDVSGSGGVTCTFVDVGSADLAGTPDSSSSTPTPLPRVPSAGVASEKGVQEVSDGLRHTGEIPPGELVLVGHGGVRSLPGDRRIGEAMGEGVGCASEEGLLDYGSDRFRLQLLARGQEGQKTLEDQQLSETVERTGGEGYPPEPCLEGHLEASGGGVSHRDPSPVSSPMSLGEKRPRASPVPIAWWTSSGETEASRQSRRVRSGLVTGTAPDQVRSGAGTEPGWIRRPAGTERRRSTTSGGRVMCTRPGRASERSCRKRAV